MSVVGQLYRLVIDDVIKNVKAEFSAEGLDDSVLQELQQIWEVKVQQSGAVNLSLGEGAEFTHHSNYPYDLNYAAGNPFLSNNPFPDLTHNPLYMNQPYMNPAQADPLTNAPRLHLPSASTQIAANALRSLNTNPTYENTLGRPQHYMPAPNWTNNPQLNTNIDTRQSNGSSAGSLQNILRQNDGADDEVERKKIDETILKKYEEKIAKKAARMEARKKKPKISQVDGNSDDEDEDTQSEPGDDELDSDLDDEDDAEPETENFVLCQYEKVTRIKNKRKTNLKDGIMHLNGRDSVFHKATGEFDW